jgi:pyrroline-5-carboxylate reductase
MTSSISDWTVALVGCGKMGTALVGGAIDAGALDPADVWCIDDDEQAASAFASRIDANRGEPSDDEPTLWIIAVKPGDVDAALAPRDIGSSDIIVSVAAGVPLRRLRDGVPPGARVVRSMPNTPALVGHGITGVFGADDEAVELAVELFGAVGEVVKLKDESHFDAVTAVSGSGPAYMFLAIEALADGGVLMGLDRDTATSLAIHTVLGSAALADAEDVHVAALKDRVASPAGTTIAGLEALEKNGFRAALIEAVRAAAERSRELGE